MEADDFMETEYMEQERKRGISAEQFGNFIAAMRREKGLTQKQLADMLYLSNKAVSKWERGLSMPDIAVLVPLADALGVTVTELLQGKRAEQTVPAEMTAGEVEALAADTQVSATENRAREQKEKRKRACLYTVGAAATWIEILLLYLQGERVGITAEHIALDVLLVAILPLLFGIWFFFLIREKLPGYYDTEKISYYADGIFRMNMAGVYFNNKNWPHILKAGRGFCFFTPIIWPAAYFLLRLWIPYEIWSLFGLFFVLFVILGGLFIPMIVAAKKYEK